MIRRLLCFLGVHEVPQHVDPEMSIYWACATCGEVFDGGMALKERKRARDRAKERAP